MARRLKVFVVPAGFHDAYVAAPSRKAALEAWGSEHDLFARGIASEVNDAALTAEPLAHPGKVIKRSRGTTAEQIAALPADIARAAPDDVTPAKASALRADASKLQKKLAKVDPKPVRVVPKPSRDALDAAEHALEVAEDLHRRKDDDLSARIASLERERRTLTEAYQSEEDVLSAKIADARDRYDRAMARWRKG